MKWWVGGGVLFNEDTSPKSNQTANYICLPFFQKTKNRAPREEFNTVQLLEM